MDQTLQIDSSAIASILGTVGSPLIVISELIKNAIDASANKVSISYSTTTNSITVADDGIGFTLEDIQKLSQPGFSRKKSGGNLTNAKGSFYTGSKGLGLLSVFSLCDNVNIHTTSDADGEYLIEWSKNTGSYSYEQIIDSQLTQGTIITLANVPPQVMTLLTSEAEVKKLRHLSTYLYKHDDFVFPRITLSIDGSTPISLLFSADFTEMLFDVLFNYDSKNETLTFQCLSDNPDINSSKITINSFETAEIEQILDMHYNIIETIKTRTNDNINFKVLESIEGVPSFEGRLLVYEKKTAGGTLKAHGAGVNIYVNDFAIYNYLSEELDWLGLSDFSQRKKATRLKPHNVFGFVNMHYFDETEEQIKISNERADFIQDTVYWKFMYLIKGVIMFLILNIDVAEKNPKYKRAMSSPKTHTSLPTDTNEQQITDTGNSGSVLDEPMNGDQDKTADQSVEYSHGDTNEDDDNVNQNQEGFDHGNGEDDQVDRYEPETVFKPQHRKRHNLVFTATEGKLIDSLKNTDDLGGKIYQTVCELSKLNILFYPYATVCLYRTLIESATQYASIKIGSTYQETALPSSITHVINKWSNMPNTSKEFKSNIGLWRDLVNKRNLIDKLNLYIHNVTPVDVDFVLDTWKSMKGYVHECIK